ncbi:MAG: AlkZ family DNA glycosylase, partial [Anaerolineales bacterium]|nr:AlkZ family DNA glycosylase [Anaerolineales bacterium]
MQRGDSIRVTHPQLGQQRLFSQRISQHRLATPAEVVRWMGAMQAQDYAMVKWAVGVRLPHSTDRGVETAVNKGEIIRTHLLRPTWHLVSADDIYWLLDLTAPRIKASLKTRHRELGLSEAVMKQCQTIIENALSGGRHLTREALIAELQKANIATDNNRASHIFSRAELDSVICSGQVKGKKQTYALLEEWVPKTSPLPKEEALARLAKRYFTSHGPATLQDFAWWSGLTAGDARQALASVQSDFVSETIDSQTYWFTNTSTVQSGQESVYLLPAFDELIISYKDRSASLPFENHNKAVSNNGMFWPIIVVNGHVTGTWKRTIKKDKVVVETTYFNQPDKTTTNLVEKAAQPFGDFLEKKVEIDDTAVNH